MVFFWFIDVISGGHGHASFPGQGARTRRSGGVVLRVLVVLMGLVMGVGCGGAIGSEGDAEDEDSGALEPELPYAASVESFSPGEGAGYGEEELPGVALGPPGPAGTTQPSLDVVSLGVEGEIVVGFGDRRIVDGEGADFVVFENAFYPGGEEEQVYQELGEVSVSLDGENWVTFDCDVEAESPGPWPGCAGWRPTREYDAEEVVPLEPEETGGDSFDLAEVGLEEARFVRVRGLSTRGAAPKTGFDFDAVGVVHGRTERD